MTQFITQSVLLRKDIHKPVTVSFDQPDSSADGYAILLEAVVVQISNPISYSSCWQQLLMCGCRRSGTKLQAQRSKTLR